MAVLEKIRVKLGILITVLIAVALLSFIVDPATLETTLGYFSSKYDVGRIDGRKVRIDKFQQDLDRYQTIYTLTTGSQAVPEEAMHTINDQVWRDLITDMYIVPQMRKAGLNVGEAELVDLSQGKEISPVILGSFSDRSGEFNRELFMQFIQSIPNDPTGNSALYWDFLQHEMTDNQYYAKYASLLSNSNILTPVELRREIDENNITSDVDFVLLPYGFSRDTTIKVSDEEIRSYYRKHYDDYRQNASRDIEFVAYEVVPSEEDFRLAEDAINRLFDEFSRTASLKSFLARNSDTPLQEYYYKKGELESAYPELDEFAFSRNPGVLPVYRKDNMFIAARVNDVKTMSDSAFVQHILLAPTDQQKADSLVGVIRRGGDFAALAAEYSLDTNPDVAEAGDLGWMTQTMMLPGMEKVLEMKAGEVASMSTGYGIHVVRVKERTTPVKKVQLALLTKEVVAGKETYQDYYSQANSLVARCEGNIANFDKITMDEELPVIPVNNVLESARSLSKYDNVREVVRWIYEAEKGDVSPIITIDNNIFFVVALKEVREDGHAPVETVAPAIRRQIFSDKRAAKMTAEVAAKIEGLTDINAVAEALGETVSSREGIAFGSLNTESLDPAFIGALSGAEEGVVSGPVAGNIGIYVFVVKGRETGAFYTEDDVRIKASQVQAYQINALPGIFSERGDVKDYRAKFF